MRSLDAIHEYVNTVCRQIRWKKAHARISEEMLNHITDSRDTYLQQGLDEEEATQNAITDAGDALVIGTQLDRIHRPKPQWGMMLSVVGFALLGIILGHVLFPGMDILYGRLFSQLIWLIIGTAFMFAAYFADFTILGKYPWRIFITVSLMAFILFYFASRHGQWIRIPYLGNIEFRYISLLFPITLVPAVYATRNKGYVGLIIALFAYGFLCLVAVAAPPIGVSGFMHFMPVGLALMIFAVMRGWFGINKWRGLLLVAVPHVSIFTWILWESRHRDFYQFRRMINPHLDPTGRGFFPLQVRRLLNNATLLGEGTTEYTRFWPIRDMPEMLYEDFLLATVAFRLGWLAFAAVLCAFIFFIAHAATRCFKQKSGLGFFVSIAIIMTFAIQVFSYVISNLGFAFIRTSLPLISPGNNAIVIYMALLGFMLSVFRTGDAVADKYSDPHTQRTGPISWQDGKLIIDFNKKVK
ncbi:MAG: permease prefix domain 1-containing protein [Defluviitaleaceae bacterium]|nr:permease prefix domain 1-containing protein [Defluviitaleaceae bacterium]